MSGSITIFDLEGREHKLDVLVRKTNMNEIKTNMNELGIRFRRKINSKNKNDK